MRKLLAVGLFLVLVCVFFVPSAFYAAEIGVNVNGRAVNFIGQEPIIIEGRTLVPVRGVFEALGFDVSWDGVTQTASISGREYLARIMVGSEIFTVNERIIALDAPARIIEGRIMLPLRNVLEGMGILVDWDAENAIVYIRDPLFAQAPVLIRAEQIQGRATTISVGSFGTNWSPYGINASYAIRQDGNLWVWGGSSATTSIIYWDVPMQIMEDVTAVAGNIYGAYIIRDNNSLWRVINTGWQRYYYDSPITPFVAYDKIMENVAYVSPGNSYTMAIDISGTLWGWGYNGYGQIGDGTSEYWDRPVRVMEDVVAVSAARTGRGRTFAIRSDGSLWAWGENSIGGLGTGMTNEGANPHPVRIMENVAAISASHETAMAITTDGVLWGWGWNISGQLGDGRAGLEHFQNPLPVQIMDGVIAVSTGALHTMAIRFDGSLWAWGSNEYGQLGDGTNMDRSSPVRVLDNIAKVSAGSTHTIALRTDGSLWIWGSNDEGQLGTGTFVSSNRPIRIIDRVKVW